MSPEHDPRFSPADEHDDELEEVEEAPRSIFSATWFRVVLVLLGVGVVGAIAVPYVLDVANAPDTSPPRTVAAPATPSPSPSAGASATKPSAPAPSGPASAPSSQGAEPTKPPATAVAPAPKSPEPKPAPEPKAAPAPEKAVAKPSIERPATKLAEKTVPRVAATRTTGEGDWFVQIGAFGDQATAKRAAARLREQNYPVHESIKRLGGGSTPAPAPRPTTRSASSAPDRYDVIVSGGSAEEINTRLAAKGLASEPAGDNVRIRPSLPLRDAVALSKDLGSEGFKVQVRRGGGAGASTSSEPAPAASPSDAGGQTLYRVRVGGYPDRTAALAIQKELQDKGFQPFIAKGRE